MVQKDQKCDAVVGCDDAERCDTMRGRLWKDGTQRAGETLIYHIRAVGDNAALDHVGCMLERRPHLATKFRNAQSGTLREIMGGVCQTKLAISGTASSDARSVNREARANGKQDLRVLGDARIRIACAEIARYARSRSVAPLKRKTSTNKKRPDCEIEEHHSTVQLH